MRDKFLVTPQICLAINDIDYVLQFIDPFVKGMYIKNKLFICYIRNPVSNLATKS